MHQRVRKEFWGYQPDEQLDNEALIGEKYRGIRPAPGYPACPEHTEKATLWELMDVKERTGIELTESMAMWPGAAVSGWYFSHPQSQYFVVGRLAQDQVADYAKRKGWTLPEAERWLGPQPRLQPGGLRPTAARLSVTIRSRRSSRGTIVRCERSCWTWTAPWSTPRSSGTSRSTAVRPSGGC